MTQEGQEGEGQGALSLLGKMNRRSRCDEYWNLQQVCGCQRIKCMRKNNNSSPGQGNRSQSSLSGVFRTWGFCLVGTGGPENAFNLRALAILMNLRETRVMLVLKSLFLSALDMMSIMSHRKYFHVDSIWEKYFLNTSVWKWYITAVLITLNSFTVSLLQSSSS